MSGSGKQPWFSAGLRFACTQCGNCCTGEPGFVWVNSEEIAKLAQVCGETPERFSEIYVTTEGNRRTLKELSDGSCVFYRPNVGCTVYEHRPRQCRTWPFWNSNLKSEEAWESAGEGCPGIGRGKIHSVEEIIKASEVIRL